MSKTSYHIKPHCYSLKIKTGRNQVEKPEERTINFTSYFPEERLKSILPVDHWDMAASNAYYLNYPEDGYFYIFPWELEENFGEREQTKLPVTDEEKLANIADYSNNMYLNVNNFLDQAENTIGRNYYFTETTYFWDRKDDPAYSGVKWNMGTDIICLPVKVGRDTTDNVLSSLIDTSKIRIWDNQYIGNDKKPSYDKRGNLWRYLKPVSADNKYKYTYFHTPLVIGCSFDDYGNIAVMNNTSYVYPEIKIYEFDYHGKDNTTDWLTLGSSFCHNTIKADNDNNQYESWNGYIWYVDGKKLSYYKNESSPVHKEINTKLKNLDITTVDTISKAESQYRSSKPISQENAIKKDFTDHFIGYIDIDIKRDTWKYFTTSKWHTADGNAATYLQIPNPNFLPIRAYMIDLGKDKNKMDYFWMWINSPIAHNAVWSLAKGKNDNYSDLLQFRFGGTTDTFCLLGYFISTKNKDNMEHTIFKWQIFNPQNNNMLDLGGEIHNQDAAFGAYFSTVQLPSLPITELTGNEDGTQYFRVYETNWQASHSYNFETKYYYYPKRLKKGDDLNHVDFEVEKVEFTFDHENSIGKYKDLAVTDRGGYDDRYIVVERHITFNRDNIEWKVVYKTILDAHSKTGNSYRNTYTRNNDGTFTLKDNRDEEDGWSYCLDKWSAEGHEHGYIYYFKESLKTENPGFSDMINLIAYNENTVE